MPFNIQDSRMWMKGSTVTGETPTIAVSSDHTDGTWTPTDVYEREWFVNTVDRKVYMLMNGSVRQVAVLPPNITTGDVLYVNSSGTISRLPIGTDGQVLSSNGTTPYWTGTTSGGGTVDLTPYTLNTTFFNYTGHTEDILTVLQSVSGCTCVLTAYTTNDTFATYTGQTQAVLNVLQSNSGSTNPNLTYGGIGCTFDGQGGTITTNATDSIRIPYNGTIVGWTLLETSNPSLTGTTEIGVWKDTYNNFEPTSSDQVFTVNPWLNGTKKNQNNSPTINTGMTAVTVGDIFRFQVISNTGCTRTNIQVHIVKS